MSKVQNLYIASANHKNFPYTDFNFQTPRQKDVQHAHNFIRNHVCNTEKILKPQYTTAIICVDCIKLWRSHTKQLLKINLFRSHQIESPIHTAKIQFASHNFCCSTSCRISNLSVSSCSPCTSSTLRRSCQKLRYFPGTNR